MTLLMEVLPFVGMIVAAVLLLLALQWLLGARHVRRPREDPELQLHQATARAQTRGTGFGP
jgi:uncharacterized protein involved in cysteine biosynthesis